MTFKSLAQKTLCLAAVTVMAEYACADNIRSAHFPPVPEGWTIEVNGNTVIYKSPSGGKNNLPSASVLRFTHTRNSGGLDAEKYIQDYINTNECERANQLGIGVYRSTCRSNKSDVVVAGEVNNMYLLEIQGEYSKSAVATMQAYLDEIIKGKHTFEDRNIGEKVYKKNNVKSTAPKAPPPLETADE